MRAFFFVQITIRIIIIIIIIIITIYLIILENEIVTSSEVKTENCTEVWIFHFTKAKTLFPPHVMHHEGLKNVRPPQVLYLPLLI